MPTRLQDCTLDVLDGILTFVGDLDTLKAAVLTCKSFKKAYYAHKTTIWRYVLQNELGGNEVIGASLRGVRVDGLLDEYDATLPGHAEEFMGRLALYDEDRTSSPTPEEYRICAERAAVCRGLEVLFSRFRKDSTTQDVSRLSPEESDRFQAALHRLWLWSSFTSPKSVVLPHCLTTATRVHLLYDGYSAQQAYDVNIVLDWLDELVVGRLVVRVDGAYRLQCAFSGPELVLKAYLDSEQSLAAVESRFRYQDWKQDLIPVFIRHNLLSPHETELRIPTEMSCITAAPDVACWRCGEKPGTRLWTDASWEHLPAKFTVAKLVERLPGKLKYNDHERALFLKFFGEEDPRALPAKAPKVTVAHVLGLLCDLPKTDNTREHAAYLARCEYSGLTSKDPLCEWCIDGLLETRMWVWWATAKKLTTPKKLVKSLMRCRNGFECRQQCTASSAQHAARFDHVCLPLRTDTL
ncbi:hypothetical protein EXIGLDRAFT_411988 [Exidia glandulosa HHB12029]|uniref:F-box domain-containing protein n=1 Tax=Exidia glandulosa HHB12029 TaxID=1314781 RepID=A0A165BFR7_EXIGL|nr:hypothetical protein EXIGLDRAFT_411988 [Exidia glandulosa HHB12029]